LIKILPIVGGSLPAGLQAPMSLDGILRAVRTHLGMEVGFISEFTAGRRVFRHVESAEGKKCIEVGGSDLLEESYCHWVAKGELPQLIRDPADYPFTACLEATKNLPVGAHLSVPILLRNGDVYGTFCCFSTQPDPSLTNRDLASMEAFAQLAGEHIQQAIDSDEERETQLCRITSILEARDLQMVYQPAIRLDEPGIEFLEALARFRSDPYESPDRWFAAAAEVGLGTELEILAVTLALEGFRAFPDTAVVSINVSPQTATSAEFQRAVSAMPLHRIILEITEHQAVELYEPVLKALEPLRKQGLRIAVDDAGAGYSSFHHILRMRPEFIKLDLALTRGIDRDSARRALAAALVWFAKETGSKLVAEGVETARELRTLRDLGVKIVQGHLMARPAPAAAINDGPDNYQANI
jgi:EAL domain-containing protein (putative c-di-GMP-specific phosphodiesterase class I)